MILNQVDPLVKRWPTLRELYILIERHGWFGPNESGVADIALVEDLDVWETLGSRDPDIMHLPIGPADFVDEEAFFPLGWALRRILMLFKSHVGAGGNGSSYSSRPQPNFRK
jgi:hypothetical protein